MFYFKNHPLGSGELGAKGRRIPWQKLIDLEVHGFGRHNDPHAVRREDHVATARARAMAAIRAADVPSLRRMVTGPTTISAREAALTVGGSGAGLDDYGGELGRIFRLGQNQLVLSRQCSP